ncbi:MAG: MaoC family dehydratase N-terminal domain-containing protein [Deltaproteobacteria bacterium]|nr:MaoC family dehydratase N-terminal domain-containing protein [Deltaproteobacteria bacterium]
MSTIVFDTSDVDRWVGVPLGGRTLRDPIHVNDVRRWSQGMQNPNPLYFDEDCARDSRFGKLVAPQSFAVCTDDSHGAAPSIQGSIPGSHMLFGGDEWWFFGLRIEPGDRITRDRMLFDYKVRETRFAGPTMFARGDTTYINHRGQVVAKQRSTSIRYLADEAQKRRAAAANAAAAAEAPEWSDDELAAIEARKLAYYRTFLDLGHLRRVDVTVGERLPQRVIGPHSIASFTSEWRAFLQNLWGAFRIDPGPTSLRQAGWLTEMDRDVEKAKIDPTQTDGLYHGPSRGHVNDRFAQRIGMPRAYGYGASMGSWILDYLGNWVGEWGDVVHAKLAYKAPALSGDVTLIDATVTALGTDPPTGQPLATLEVVMKNQRDEVMAEGVAEVRLPTVALPAS